MWLYVQRSGALYHGTSFIAKGYAGRYTGQNNPDMQNVKDTGPLPCGWYTMKRGRNSARLGPMTIDLVPDESNAMFDREDFRMHGERTQPPPGLASDGCIIQSRIVRDHVDSLIATGDDRLQVVAEELELTGNGN
jgi:hypothetical protein